MALSEDQLDNLLRDGSCLSKLFTFLKTENYSFNNVAELFGAETTDLVKNALYSSLMYANQTPETKLELLTNLFLFGGKVKIACYQSLLSKDNREMLERYQLVKVGLDEMVEGQLTIGEYETYYFLSDQLYAIDDDGNPKLNTIKNVVWPMSEWSLELYENLSENQSWQTFLDVGCGSGCVAILAHKRYAEVYGIDINDRAIKFSKINAKINSIKNANFFVDDCFAMGDTKKYDHIVFAVPSGPTFADEGTLVAHGGRLGHEMGIRFLSEAVEKILAPQGGVDIWAIFSIEEKYRSVMQLLQTTLGNSRFVIDVKPQNYGGNYISNENISQRKLPPLSHYTSEADPEIFIQKLIEHKICEVTPAIVRLQRKS